MCLKRTVYTLLGLMTIVFISSHANASVAGGDLLNEQGGRNVPADAGILDYSQDGDQVRDARWQGYGHSQHANTNGAGVQFIPGGKMQERGFVRSAVNDGTPFWYCGCTTIDLNELLAFLRDLNILYEIDNSGQIFGTINIFGKIYSFMIRPEISHDMSEAPIPGAVILLGSSLGAVGLWRRRRV